MLDKIKRQLETISGIDEWKILEHKTESKELFYVRKDCDMNRRKEVTHYEVEVFHNFEEQGEKLKGSSLVKLSPTMEESEIKEILEEAIYAATFVKNKWYPIADAYQGEIQKVASKFSEADVMDKMAEFTDSIYAETGTKARINSAEVFIDKNKKRIVNSKGLDVSFDTYKGEIETVTDHKEGEEAVELFSIINFSDACYHKIQEDVKLQLLMTEERAKAEKSPSIKSIHGILANDAVKELFDFYLTHANAQAVYEKISSAKLGESFQGEDVKGDKISITLLPILENSSKSAPFDEDGVKLEELKLYEEGVLCSYFGKLQYTSYLGVAPTGNLKNFQVREGSKTAEEMKKEPYVELLSFSAFQMNPFTGDFGGEFRLAKYFDGTTTKYITGGSISANIFDMQKEMYFSKETMQDNNYKGPKLILFKNIEVAGQ